MSEQESANKWAKYAWAAPYVRFIVPLGMIIVLGCMGLASSVWQDWQMRGVLDAAQARSPHPMPSGYYSQTRETPSGVRDVEIGAVRSILNFESGMLVEVVVDSGVSRPVVIWAVANGTLRPGDACVMKWVDSVNFRERQAFKIETGKEGR